MHISSSRMLIVYFRVWRNLTDSNYPLDDTPIILRSHVIGDFKANERITRGHSTQCMFRPPAPAVTRKGTQGAANDHTFIRLQVYTYSCWFVRPIEVFYTVVQKTRHPPICSPNIDRFSKFFHWYTQQMLEHSVPFCPVHLHCILSLTIFIWTNKRWR